LTAQAESAERGYVITEDEDYLAMFDEIAIGLDQVEQQLQQLVADNALQRRRAQQLTELASHRMAALRAVDEARGGERLAAAQELIRNGAGKRIHGQLRQQIDEIASIETSLLLERQRRADRSTSGTLVIGASSSALALVFVAWAAWVGRRDRTERRHIEAEREALKGRLTVQLEDMRRLHQLGSKLMELSGITEMLEEFLDATVELQGADFGNVQIYDPKSGALHIVAQRGFSPDFLEHFSVVNADDPSVCGRALRSRARVVVEDIESAPVRVRYQRSDLARADPAQSTGKCDQVYAERLRTTSVSARRRKGEARRGRYRHWDFGAGSRTNFRGVLSGWSCTQ